MKAFTTTLAAVTALLTTLTTALPVSSSWPSTQISGRTAECLSQADAAYIVNGFALLINSTFNANLAAAILAPTFIDYSDSIDFLAGLPLGTAPFTSLATFEAGQSGQAPVPLQVLSIDAVSCTNIAFRWLAYPGSGRYEVKGINIAYTARTGNANNGADGWQIQTNFVEFNAAAWDLDIGGTCTAPPPSRAMKV
jgi:hypothetical protein